MQPDVSIVVVSWNTREMLRACLQSLLDTTRSLRTEILVVDNDSSDGSARLVRECFPHARLIANTENRGFAAASNQGVATSTGEFVLLFNSDAVALPGSIEALLARGRREPRAGLVGARLLHPDGSFQASHAPFPTLGTELLVLSGLGRLWNGPWYPSRGPDEARTAKVVESVSGACLLARRRSIDQVGGLDDGFFLYAEEVDWCYAMRTAGWQVWYEPAASILHHGGGSARHQPGEREAALYRGRVRFFRKHYGNGSARALKALILGFTATKILWHGALRGLTGGRRGRPVVQLRTLHRTLRSA